MSENDMENELSLRCLNIYQELKKRLKVKYKKQEMTKSSSGTISRSVSKRATACATHTRQQLNSQLGFADNIYALDREQEQNPLSVSLPHISSKMLGREKVQGLERDFFFNYKMSELTSSNVLLKLGNQVESYTKNEI